MADYTLPDLPYDYSALEPHISGTIMELHHDKHHQAYVTGANTALAAARRGPRLGQPRERQQAREGPRVQPRRPRQPLDLLDEPVARRRRQARPASSPRPSTSTSARSTSSRRTSPPPRSACRAPAGRCSRWDSLGQQPDHRAVLRPAGQPRRRHRPAAACSTCGSTPTTSTTRTCGPTTSRRSGTSRTGRTSSSASTAAREKTSGLLLLS